MQKIFYNRHAAAEALSITTRTLDRLVISGQIQAHRIGTRVLFTPAELQKFAKGTEMVSR